MIEKVKGTENPADLMTKHLDGPSMEAMLHRMGLATRDGRAVSAPTVVRDEKTKVTFALQDEVLSFDAGSITFKRGSYRLSQSRADDTQEETPEEQSPCGARSGMNSRGGPLAQVPARRRQHHQGGRQAAG